MSRHGTPRLVKFILAYVVVFGLMLGWWLALQASTSIGVALTLVVAYAAPAAAWLVLGAPLRRRRNRA